LVSRGDEARVACQTHNLNISRCNSCPRHQNKSDKGDKEDKEDKGDKNKIISVFVRNYQSDRLT